VQSVSPPPSSLPLSVVVPCYNEQDGIGELVSRVQAACLGAGVGDHEIVLVDDGSSDRTWAAIARHASEDPRVVGVKLSRNHGHQLALSAGLTFARGERILILDADLQDPPELLGAMMAEMDRGSDVVYGRRRVRHGETTTKKLTAFVFYRLLRALTDVPIPADTGDFRLMTRRALNVLLAMPEQHRFIRGMVSWVGFRQSPVDYDRQPRFVGETKYPLRKMIKFAIDAITGFSTKPLRLATILGLLVGVLGLVLTGYALLAWALDDVVPGWTSTIVPMLLLGSMNLFVLGIIGEYLGRLYMESKARPLFIVEDVARAQTADRVEQGPGDKRVA
jgi:glycosyltransferase involved in cell wall biosynthesis